MNSRFEINWPSSVALIGCLAIYAAYKAYTGAPFTEEDFAIAVSITLGFMARQPVKSCEPRRPSIHDQVAALKRELEKQRRQQPAPQTGLRPPPLPRVAEPFDEEETGEF